MSVLRTFGSIIQVDRDHGPMWVHNPDGCYDLTPHSDEAEVFPTRTDEDRGDAELEARSWQGRLVPVLSHDDHAKALAEAEARAYENGEAVDTTYGQYRHAQTLLDAALARERALVERVAKLREALETLDSEYSLGDMAAGALALDDDRARDMGAPCPDNRHAIARTDVATGVTTCQDCGAKWKVGS